MYIIKYRSLLIEITHSCFGTEPFIPTIPAINSISISTFTHRKKHRHNSPADCRKSRSHNQCINAHKSQHTNNHTKSNLRTYFIKFPALACGKTWQNHIGTTNISAQIYTTYHARCHSVSRATTCFTRIYVAGTTCGVLYAGHKSAQFFL